MTAVLPQTEAQFMEAVTQLAELRGWGWVHFRPARTEKGWRTPVQGPLGKGWVDLVLVRERPRQLLFVELKRDGEKPTPDQATVLRALTTVVEGISEVGWSTRQRYQELHDFECPRGGLSNMRCWNKPGCRREPLPLERGLRARVAVWHPSDWPEIERVLA